MSPAVDDDDELHKVAQTTWPKVCRHVHISPCGIVKNVIPKPWALVCGYNGLNSSGFRLSTRFDNQAAGISSHSTTRVLVMLTTDVGR